MPQVLKLEFEPTHRAASEIRRQLRALLESNGVADAVLADVELAASELLSNAVDQAPGRPVEVLASIDEVSIHLTITNWHQPGSAVAIPEYVDDDEFLNECGRGLEIVRALADGMWIHGDHTSTSVSCLHRR